MWREAPIKEQGGQCDGQLLIVTKYKNKTSFISVIFSNKKSHPNYYSASSCSLNEMKAKISTAHAHPRNYYLVPFSLYLQGVDKRSPKVEGYNL